jgi:hypothetical protein
VGGPGRRGRKCDGGRGGNGERCGKCPDPALKCSRVPSGAAEVFRPVHCGACGCARLRTGRPPPPGFSFPHLPPSSRDGVYWRGAPGADRHLPSRSHARAAHGAPGRPLYAATSARDSAATASSGLRLARRNGVERTPPRLLDATALSGCHQGTSAKDGKVLHRAGVEVTSPPPPLPPSGWAGQLTALHRSRTYVQVPTTPATGSSWMASQASPCQLIAREPPS